VLRISEFHGIVIYMYFQDHNPPHFRAFYAEHEALIRIDSGEVIRGRPPKTAGSLVEEWRLLHVGDLIANWELAGEPAARPALSRLSSGQPTPGPHSVVTPSRWSVIVPCGTWTLPGLHSVIVNRPERTVVGVHASPRCLGAGFRVPNCQPAGSRRVNHDDASGE
jgi:hypothetical protein